VYDDDEEGEGGEGAQRDRVPFGPFLSTLFFLTVHESGNSVLTTTESPPGEASPMPESVGEEAVAAL